MHFRNGITFACIIAVGYAGEKLYYQLLNWFS